jgi:uncharacterized membrane protein YfhO
MESLKRYFLTRSEQTFALLILVSAYTISYFIPYKLIFLNFYLLVITMGTYYLDVQKAVLGGVLSALLVVIHVYYFPNHFKPAFTDLDLWMNILAWFGFLILTGAAVGKLSSRLKRAVTELEDTKTRLEEANRGLVKHALSVEEWVTRLARSD